MKILCAYWDLEGDCTEDEIRNALAGHDVSVARSYQDVRFLTERDDCPFDIILSDVWLRYSSNSVERFPAGGFLIGYIEKTCIKGIGIFVPDYFESVYELSGQNCRFIVVSKECCKEGKRDWRMLLEKVAKRMGISC